MTKRRKPRAVRPVEPAPMHQLKYESRREIAMIAAFSLTMLAALACVDWMIFP